MEQYSQLIFLGLMLAVFWFLVIRPQQERAKAQRAMVAALKPGDAIVTSGGIYATVVEVGERIRISIADGSEMELAPFAVAGVIAEDADAGPAQADVKTGDGSEDADA